MAKVSFKRKRVFKRPMKSAFKRPFYKRNGRYPKKKRMALMPRYRSLTPFPNTRIVRHKYCDNFTIPAAVGAGLPASYSFRCNSVFDPDRTGTGHQPMFHDEMLAQYNYYTVLKSSIRIVFENASTVGQSILLWVDDDFTIPSSITDTFEQHYVNIPATKPDKARFPYTLRAYYNGARWNKMNQAALLAYEKTQSGSNPAVSRYFHLYCAPTASSSTLTAQYAYVEIQYTVMWRETVDHTGS